MFRRQIRWRSYWGRVKEWASIAMLVVMVVVPVGGLLWLVLFTDTFAVQAVVVVDAREHTTAQVKEVMGRTVGANMLFVQTDILEQQILTNLLQVRTVHIARKLPGTLKVVIQEKEPALLLLSQGKYYFVDVDGVAYEEASLDRLPGVVLPTIKNDDAEGEVTVGVRVVGATFVEFISQVMDQLPEVVGAQVVEIRIPSLAAREVHVLLDNNWEVKFEITRAAPGQLNVLRQLLAGTVTEEEQQTLEYIDLRIPSRVYYKTR